MKRLFILALTIAMLACAGTKDDPDPQGNEQTDQDETGGNPMPGNGQPGVVGTAGLDEWDKLSTSEKNRIKSWNTIFMHQSVGGDLEDGAEGNGFKFAYFDLSVAPTGLSGNVFSVSNGDPDGKMAEFRKNILAHKSAVRIAIFKFGYADINDGNLEAAKVSYQKMIDELRSQVPGLKFVHITPPLIYILTKDDGNAAKMKMAQWMKDTFSGMDVIFDLESIESDNGACKLGAVWSICDKYRSTAGCPSKSQGVDAAEGQGHLCEKEAVRISKAFLLSIYRAGK